MMDACEITLLNFGGLNEKRKDVKHPSWVRLNHDYPQSQSLFDLTAVEVCVHTFLICFAGKKNSARIKFRADWFCQSWAGGRFDEATLRSTLTKLAQCEDPSIEIHALPLRWEGLGEADKEHETGTLRVRDVPDTSTRRDETDGRDETDETDVTVSRGADADGTPPPGSVVWDAYATAYERRYKAPPVRNAQTNSLCKRLANLLGATEAPEVARFYVERGEGFYALRGHALEFLVKDAGKLRTEWATGRVIKPKSRAEQVSDANRDLYQRVDRGEA